MIAHNSYDSPSPEGGSEKGDPENISLLSGWKVTFKWFSGRIPLFGSPFWGQWMINRTNRADSSFSRRARTALLSKRANLEPREALRRKPTRSEPSRGHTADRGSVKIDVPWKAMDVPVSAKKHPFCWSLCHAIFQQKLLSSPWFGALKADVPMRIILRRSVFSQTPVGRQGIDSFCKEIPCFNTVPCRPMPLLVHFWELTVVLHDWCISLTNRGSLTGCPW